LSPPQVNDAVTILVENGFAEWQRFLGTAPFVFGYVQITPRGRVELERIRQTAVVHGERQPGVPERHARPGTPPEAPAAAAVAHAPHPIGSPYGFEDEDWELVADRRSNREQLNVVLGYQFRSDHFRADDLAANVQAMFSRAMEQYSHIPGAVPAALHFQALSAGYGEHLSSIRSRAISFAADIAVFELDLNPNVMLELGVVDMGSSGAGDKSQGRHQPPSDISGHTGLTIRVAPLSSSIRSIRMLVRTVERARYERRVAPGA
jgi:hypothetical protein